MLVFLSLFLFLCACQNTPDGVINLDSATFDKIVGGKRPVFVKFDVPHPHGEKFETWKSLGEAVGKLGTANEILLADVGVKEYGEKENDDIRARFHLNPDKFPHYLLFPAYTKTPFTFTELVRVPNFLRFIKKHTGQFIGSESQVTTLAGNGSQGHHNSAPRSSTFKFPSSIAIHPKTGLVLVADSGNHKIRVITDKIVETVCGDGRAAYKDGKPSEASFNGPYGISFNGNQQLLVADYFNHRIRAIELDSSLKPTSVATLAGSGESGFLDGAPTTAKFSHPADVKTWTKDGTIFVADFFNHRIRVINPATREVSTYAGTGLPGFEDGDRQTTACFFHPSSIAVHQATGDVYVVDYSANRVRVINKHDGAVVTIAGNGRAGWVDSLGRLAQFSRPFGLALDDTSSDPIVYVADYDNHRIRQVSRSKKHSGKWEVSTLAGTGLAGSSDSSGSTATFRHPFGVAFVPQPEKDKHGEKPAFLLVADSFNHQIRKITLDE